jgi:hypothetical protein
MKRLLDILNFSRLVAALPFVFALHNAEEAVYMPGFAPEIAKLPVRVGQEEFLWALLILTVLGFILAYVARRRIGEGVRAWVWIVLITQSVLFINAFSHAGISIYLGAMAPGAYTALIINIPFSIILFASAFNEGLAGWKSLGKAMAIGAVLYVPLILASIAVGKLIARLG